MLTRSLISVALFVFSAAPMLANFIDTSTFGNYTVYDCGQSGSADYDACQTAMALGEDQFEATYNPVGSPWDYDYSGLGPPRTGWAYGTAAVSADGLWAVITELREPQGPGEVEDSIPDIVWHDDSFSSIGNIGIDLVNSGSNVEINDQGGVAGYMLDDCVAVPGQSCTGYFAAFPDWYFGALPPILNDDNQVLAEGIDGDYLLFDPNGAPTPSPVPEAPVGLLTTVMVLTIPLLRIRVAAKRSKSMANVWPPTGVG
jgi:hypothetical protein